MWCWRHTIQLKCTISYPVNNSLLSTCIQLHQSRLCMHFFSQTTPIHHVRINITIITSRVNQNRNNMTTSCTLHLNNGYLVMCLLVSHNCINLRDIMAHVSNHRCLMITMDRRPTTLVQWKLLLAVIFMTNPNYSGPLPSTLFYCSPGCDPCPFSTTLNFL